MHGGFLFNKVDGRPGTIARNTAKYEDKCFYLGGKCISISNRLWHSQSQSLYLGWFLSGLWENLLVRCFLILSRNVWSPPAAIQISWLYRAWQCLAWEGGLGTQQVWTPVTQVLLFVKCLLWSGLLCYIHSMHILILTTTLGVRNCFLHYMGGEAKALRS